MQNERSGWAGAGQALRRSAARGRTVARYARDWQVWDGGHARLLIRQVVRPPLAQAVATDDRLHLRAAAEWLARAQDSQPDGGISGRYHLRHGWTSSYPETTGYAIPTLLAAASWLDAPAFVERARRCVAFLLSLQLDGGGFPGMEVAHNRTEPSAFNTAQILHGLLAWHRARGDREALTAARRAADWLLTIQDADGAWRRHVYAGTPATYTAHLSCWLAELGDALGEPRYLAAAERHLDWVLAHRDAETGWFDAAGFDADWHGARTAFTHTIAYTVWGVLLTGTLTGRADAVAAALQAARAIARRLELSGRLPGQLDWRWRARSADQCLTGNAQMALIWMRLHALTGDATLLGAALKAIDLVKAAQSLDSPHPGIRGGIPGSDPVWGSYIQGALPNWAAKFFIDALIAKEDALARLAVPAPRPAAEALLRLPTRLPPAVGQAATPPAVVLLSRPGNAKLRRLLAAWSRWGFVPRAIVLEQPAERPMLARLERLLREGGVAALRARLLARARPRAAAPAPDGFDLADWARRQGVEIVTTGPLDSAAAVKAVARLAPDLLVHAGAGILRAPLLALPRLGTLNAHMGILPRYRGIHVAEWAALNGDPAGCSVHLIDPGIDTGDILCVRAVDVAGVRDVAGLRAAVDAAQIGLLGEVVQYVLATGALPPRHPQQPADGIQHFALHPELAARLDQALAAAPTGAAPRAARIAG